jgi:hypothetical protein
MDLTMCGLLVEETEEMSRLYAEHSSWSRVKNIWFEERMDDRSTKGSSQKLYRVLSSRLKSASGSLPAVSILPDILDKCDTRQDKAQVLYLYLLDSDPLVNYTVHEYASALDDEETTLQFDDESVGRVLQNFHYDDGGQYDYAESTTYRWKKAFRTVMRDIGCIDDERSTEGTPPTVGDVPLLVFSGYSWEELGSSWLESPIGWLYLFQPPNYWEKLADRLSQFDSWSASEFQGGLRFTLTEDTYSWATEEEA